MKVVRRHHRAKPGLLGLLAVVQQVGRVKLLERGRITYCSVSLRHRIDAPFLCYGMRDQRNRSRSACITKSCPVPDSHVVCHWYPRITATGTDCTLCITSSAADASSSAIASTVARSSCPLASCCPR